MQRRNANPIFFYFRTGSTITPQETRRNALVPEFNPKNLNSFVKKNNAIIYVEVRTHSLIRVN